MILSTILRPTLHTVTLGLALGLGLGFALPAHAQPGGGMTQVVAGEQAEASTKVTLLRRQLGNHSVQTVRLEVNRNKGTAYAVLTIHNPDGGYGESYSEEPEYEVNAELPGLSFDAETNEVLFTRDGEQVVVGHYKRATLQQVVKGKKSLGQFLRGTRVELTDAIQFETQQEKRPASQSWSNATITTTVVRAVIG